MEPQKNKKASRSRKTREPYFTIRHDDADWQAAFHDLVGFDVHRSWAKLERWLRDNRFQKTSRFGNTTLRRPEPGEPNEARAEAVFAVMFDFHELQNMWAPERLAAKRWYHALGDLRRALEVAQRAADVRLREEAFFLGHTTGIARNRYGADHEQTRALVEALKEVQSRVADADRRIPRYSNDNLPAVDATGRRIRTYLSRVEARLESGGFSIPEISQLIFDPQRLRKPAARKAHHQRITKRIKDFKKDDAMRAAQESSLAAEREALVAVVPAHRTRKKVRK